MYWCATDDGTFELLDGQQRTISLCQYVSGDFSIYEYLLTGKEKYLSLRQFDEEDACTAYEQQQGICPICKKHFDFDKMHADHITPWHAGGKTVPENLQMLCRDCNLKKSGQE